MYKIGICGHFGVNKLFSDGQTIKTKVLAEELKKRLGFNFVHTIDTCGWKNRPFSLLVECYFLVKNCKNIVIMPAHNGVRIFVPVFLFFNKIFNRKLHYVVIGGWLPELLKKHDYLLKKLNYFDGIYVETMILLEALKKLGLSNVRYLPNFKQLVVLKEDDLIYPKGEPYKVCTFSRVMQEKGIEDAIYAVKNINENMGRIVYTLDIFGQIDDKYCERFEILKKDFPGYITYKGIVNFNDSVGVIKNYFMLLFPTHFQTEGIPGTIIDAYAAGVPVVVSRWNSAEELVTCDTGFVYKNGQVEELNDILKNIIFKPDMVLNRKRNCLSAAEKFIPDNAINWFLMYIEEE